MKRPDYYAVLEVPADIAPSALKLAYYRQAKKYHPDLNPGDAAAEDRFKLIAEAYRILGDERERRLYDEARERDIRYADAPELAGMVRKVRFSARRNRRENGERPSLRRRFTLLPARKKMPWWVMFLMGVFWISALLPFIMRTGSTSLSRREYAGKEEKPEPEAGVVRARLGKLREKLEAAAAAGDARAQLHLGLMLYNGSAGVQMDREAARDWWKRAAAQGDRTAAFYLEKCDFNPPAQQSPVGETP
ncbi:MAG: DnaJ domain-containing protein [Akkermansia sp.]|nr:DnaJ domain-containing protein [Akkermansia sp.]MBR2314857.1 DnaJ domain-containing protein [Akkermansia sp.]